MHLLIVPCQLLVVLVEELCAYLLDLLKLVFISCLSLFPLPVYLIFCLPNEAFDLRTLVLKLLLEVLFRTSQLLLGHNFVALDTRLQDLNLLIEELVCLLDLQGQLIP